MKRRIKKIILCSSLVMTGFLSACSKKQIDNNPKVDLSNLGYEQDLKNINKFDQEKIIQSTYLPLEELNDDDIVNIPSDYINYIKVALNTDKNKFTCGELKKIVYLKIVPTDQELNWINYCTNLRQLSLSYSYKTSVTNNIKELPYLKKVSIYNASGMPIDINCIDFKFIQNIENLSIENDINIDEEFLSTTNIKELSIISGFQNKIDYKKLSFLGKINIDVDDKQPYNTAIYFTSDDLKYLNESGVIVTCGTKVMEINKQLDEINKSLNISSNESNLEKYKKIATYVINRMEYPEVLSDSNSSYYEGGFLSGALDEDENGVCGNYSSLTTALCLRNNIDSYILSSGHNGKHAWNLVKLNGRYYSSDLTSLDTCQCEDTRTKERISIEEYIDRNGLDESFVRYFMFDNEDYNNDIYNAISYPNEYLRQLEKEAVITREVNETPKLKLKRK